MTQTTQAQIVQWRLQQQILELFLRQNHIENTYRNVHFYAIDKKPISRIPLSVADQNRKEGGEEGTGAVCPSSFCVVSIFLCAILLVL